MRSHFYRKDENRHFDRSEGRALWRNLTAIAFDMAQQLNYGGIGGLMADWLKPNCHRTVLISDFSTALVPRFSTPDRSAIFSGTQRSKCLRRMVLHTPPPLA